MSQYEKIRNNLMEHGLKVTPQRIAVYEALCELNNHPTADNIIQYVLKKHPYISAATVYNTLETFTRKCLINKVKTEHDVMRYDAMLEKHHHLYCEDTGEIIDYRNAELNMLIENFFSENSVPGFEIKDINLQIVGKKINI